MDWYSESQTHRCPICEMEHLEAMYPDVYYQVNPMVEKYCMMYDVPSNPGFYPCPTRAAVEQAADYICQCMMANPQSPATEQFRGILRPLVLILLIRALLRRRRFI